MITEDYVSFELAELLRDKGFNIQTQASITVFAGTTYVVNGEKITPKKDTIIPTLQTAMKWLREVHNIFIEINIIPHTTVTVEQKYYFFKLYKDRRPHNFPLNFSVKLYSSYEQACKAAIKYCLENLI